MSSKKVVHEFMFPEISFPQKRCSGINGLIFRKDFNNNMADTLDEVLFIAKLREVGRVAPVEGLRGEEHNIIQERWKDQGRQ